MIERIPSTRNYRRCHEYTSRRVVPSSSECSYLGNFSHFFPHFEVCCLTHVSLLAPTFHRRTLLSALRLGTLELWGLYAMERGFRHRLFNRHQPSSLHFIVFARFRRHSLTKKSPFARSPLSSSWIIPGFLFFFFFLGIFGIFGV